MERIVKRILDAETDSELLSEMCATFAKLAGVTNTSVFFGVVLSWDAVALRHGEETYLRDLLSDVRHTATALREQLEAVNKYLVEKAAPRFKDDGQRWYDLDYIALRFLPPSDITAFLERLAPLTDTLNGAAPNFLSGKVVPNKGRKAGDQRYPGLDTLVLNLELAAQGGGGGFTVHRKLGPKGSLIKALNSDLLT